MVSFPKNWDRGVFIRGNRAFYETHSHVYLCFFHIRFLSYMINKNDCSRELLAQVTLRPCCYWNDFLTSSPLRFRKCSNNVYCTLWFIQCQNETEATVNHFMHWRHINGLTKDDFNKLMYGKWEELFMTGSGTMNWLRQSAKWVFSHAVNSSPQLNVQSFRKLQVVMIKPSCLHLPQ